MINLVSVTNPDISPEPSEQANPVSIIEDHDNTDPVSDASDHTVVTTLDKLIPVTGFTLYKIHYFPTHVTGPEPLMYVTLHTLGHPIKAMIDSATTSTLIGPKGMEVLSPIELNSR